MPWDITGCTSLNTIPLTVGGLTYDQLQGTYNDLQGSYNDLSPQVQSDVVIVGFDDGEMSYEDATRAYDEHGALATEFEAYITSKLFTQPKLDRYWHECRVYYDATNTSNIELWISVNKDDFVLNTELTGVEPLVQEFIRTRKVRRGRTYQFKVVINPVDALADNQGQTKLTGYEIDYTLAGESKR